jgi:uncharacterized damage-inducible protein DinB
MGIELDQLIEEYLAGPAMLRRAVAGLSGEQLRARPVPGKWSTLEVVCHLSDFEAVYADRMKRVIAEPEPPLRSGDPDLFAASLAYHSRDLDEELTLVETTRRQMARILRSIPPQAFQRTGIHSSDGPITLEALLRRITGHIPHHVRFIDQKRKSLLDVGS